MKLNTLQKLYNCLKYEIPEVTVPDEVPLKELKPIARMMTLS